MHKCVELSDLITLISDIHQFKSMSTIVLIDIMRHLMSKSRTYKFENKFYFSNCRLGTCFASCVY